jgi:hypothetical protein
MTIRNVVYLFSYQLYVVNYYLLRKMKNKKNIINNNDINGCFTTFLYES